MKRVSFADFHDDDLVDTPTAAELLRRAAHSLENLRSSGGGPLFRQAIKGGAVRYRVGDLKEWSARNTRGATF